LNARVSNDLVFEHGETYYKIEYSSRKKWSNRTKASLTLV